jgi:hypothetical protein
VLSGGEYFERMLSTEFKEAAAKEVKLEAVEGDRVRKLRCWRSSTSTQAMLR